MPLQFKPTCLIFIPLLKLVPQAHIRYIGKVVGANPARSADQRRTIGYFIDHKFNPGVVTDELARYGFKTGNYTIVIVTWGWTDEAVAEARLEGIELWDIRDILDAITDTCRDSRSYFAGDTLRTVQLLQRSGGGK